MGLTVTAEVAGSSPVVPAIHSKRVMEFMAPLLLPTNQPTAAIGSFSSPSPRGTLLEPPASPSGRAQCRDPELSVSSMAANAMHSLRVVLLVDEPVAQASS